MSHGRFNVEPNNIFFNINKTQLLKIRLDMH